MVDPIQPIASLPVIAVDTVAGQIERGQSGLPRLVVNKKENTTAAREEIPREEVENATDKFNRMMKIINKKMKFEVNEKANRIVVTIIDENSGEVLNEIPPVKMVEMLGSIEETIGLLVDERV